MIIGFTGTRYGMNKFQLEQFQDVVGSIPDKVIEYVVHGGCVGADANFHGLCLIRGFNIHVRPGHSAHDKSDNQSFAYEDGATIIHPSKTYFDRNRDIVDECDLLIAAPPCNTNPGRGGTWYTTAYAQKQGKRVEILFRNRDE